MYYIYRITNKVNGKTYIGQHKYLDLNDKYKGSGKRLWEAYRKYGFENFKKEILEFDIPNVDLANDWEQMYILFERAKGKAEYNIADGGSGNKGHKLSDEVKKKISEKLKGRHHTEEAKRKISEAQKGKPSWNKGKSGYLSEETRKKMSEANKGNQNRKGKHHSEETRKKISEAMKGNQNSKGKHWKLVDGKRVWY